MFRRDILAAFKKYKLFPVLAVLGPRQSGKTTLVKAAFARHVFVSLENPRDRELAINEPERFLKIYAQAPGVIIDEFQYAPELLSYIQLAVDAHKQPNYFILTGSQNFLVNQAITQSLAGRVGIVTLLPLSLHELSVNKLLSHEASEVIFNGFYPRLYDEHVAPEPLYSAYIQTYVERDVRQLVNVGDLHAFQTFVRLCAARISNVLNLSDLATVCGVSVPTARRWISILEASYIVFLLEPHFQNFNKRLTKSPKIYFYDTGLACNLLRIDSARDLLMSSHWGALFECFIIADIAKQYYNRGLRPPLYFWRDKNGRIEIDCLIDHGQALVPIEIKASEGVSAHFFDSLRAWQALARDSSVRSSAKNSFLIYGGTRAQEREYGLVVPWKASARLVEKIKKE